MTAKFLKIYKVWLVIGLILWHAYFFSIGNAMPLYIDLLAVSFYSGSYLFKKYQLNSLVAKYPKTLLYFISAYGMVLLEEFIAAFINNLNEGFQLGLFVIRVGQFWAFNIIVFSGVIIAMYTCSRLRILDKRELIVLIVLFGTYAEHIYTQGSLVVFFVYAPIVMLIYYFIFSPAISVLQIGETRKMHALFRYVSALFLVGILTIPFVLVLSQLRQDNPNYFPPCEMISCE